MRSYNEPIINAADASTNQTSILVKSENLHLASLHVITTGTAVGSVKLQASNDEPANNVAPNNWADITGATVAISGAGSYLIPNLDICYNYVRAVYTFTSGTGTVSAKVHMIGY